MKTVIRMACVASVALALPACDRVGNPMEALSGKRPAPDEFQVVTRKPLQMPATLSALPEPRLGERSPLEHDPYGDATTALVGTPTLPTATAPSGGEQALLSAANANSQDPNVQANLVAAETKLIDGKPYEAPTVLELLNLDGKRQEDVLDANAESRRLRSDGVAAAPVNPADQPEEAEKDDGYVSPGERFTPQFPYGNQQKRGRP